MTVEHLGCRQWSDDSNGRYARHRPLRLGHHLHGQRTLSTSADQHRTEGVARRAPRRDRSGRPVGPNVAVQPTPLYLGEGAPLYAGGLGTVSLVPLPTYLLQAGSRQQPKLLDLEKLDKNLAYAQVLAFARTLAALDAAPDSAF